MSTVAAANTTKPSLWEGGIVPYGISYGKMMMWFFLLSDAFTFSALLLTYGSLRFSASFWPNPDTIFNSVPFIDGLNLPLVFVSIMTFILIMSSVTMVLAVEAGQRLDKAAVTKWMMWTILGGIAFLGCQALEWTHLHHEGFWWGHYPDETKFLPKGVPPQFNFSNLFFTITGFHGFHVFSGVVINCIILAMNNAGVFARRGHYEMVEKVGLYWHFVDLVWVFVFTFFYLV